MRRATLAFIALLLFATTTAASADAWTRPVDGPVVKPFEQPLTPYGPGHRGVHFAVQPGTPVRAVAAGTVAFAGEVAGAMHVVVQHANGWRTSYSFLATRTVSRGDHVEAGTIVGTTGGRAPGHNGAVLHFGVRIGDVYVDPMRLFVSPGAAGRVHLAPVDGR
jgi:murein DD-endopeptidase MepM/ murein hydrolase activator NlpD